MQCSGREQDTERDGGIEEERLKRGGRVRRGREMTSEGRRKWQE